MPAYINVSDTWRSITSLYVNVSSTWRTVTNGYVNVAGTWRSFFTSTLTPSIASTVTISRNNATYPSTLTGTNFRWTNSTSLTYVFQKSSDNSNFTNIGSATSIANPSAGSSNTVTYALTLADMPAYTSYYRFVVTAVNSTYSTSATSTSTSVSVNQPAPINNVQPTITPSSGTAGVTQYSVNSNGTWNPDDTDGVYAYLWQSSDNPPTNTIFVPAPGTNNLSTYTPPSNFFTLGYTSPIRCRVTATNPSGSTSAFSSNTASVSAPVVIPSGGSVSISTNTGNYNVGSVITFSTFGWSGSPTSYSLRLYNGTNPVLTSDPLRASTSSTSGTYTIVSADVPNFFKAFATASNSAGTSAEASSVQVGPAVQPVPVNISAPSVSPSSGTAGSTTYSCTTGSWTNSPTSFSYQWRYFDSNIGAYQNLPSANSSTYLPPSSYVSVYGSILICRVVASNVGGDSSPADSSSVTVSAPVSIPSGGTVTLTGSSTPGSVITASTSGWSGSPTSYDVYITTALFPSIPTSGSSRVASSGGGSSTTYTITSSDAIAPVNIFRAFATASNSAGTSSTVQSSNTITSTAAGGGGAAPVLISITGNNSLQYGGTFTWSFSNSPTAYSIFVSGPNGTVYSTINAYTYSTTTFRPGYDGNIAPPPFPSGSYTINVSARNASGDSTVATVTTFMS